MGYGDDIMATATARELRQKHPHAKIVVGDGAREHWSAIYENNPHLSRLAQIAPGDEVVWLREYPGNRPYLDYEKIIPLKRHFFRREFRARPGELYFSPQEKAQAAELTQRLGQFIVIEPNIKGTFSGNNKDWGFDKWQQVVNRMGAQYRFIQLGPPESRTLIGVERISTVNFRLACAILARARGCATSEGGLHHAAGALSIPGVVIFGGHTHPDTTGYDVHTNLYVEKGSPCGMLAPCRHCRKCMEAITVDMVVAALYRRLHDSAPRSQRL